MFNRFKTTHQDQSPAVLPMPQRDTTVELALPSFLHSQLELTAAYRGVSLEELIVSELADAVG